MNDFADYILRNTLWMNNNNNNDAIEWSVTAIFIDYKDKQQITGYYDKSVNLVTLQFFSVFVLNFDHGLLKLYDDHHL